MGNSDVTPLGKGCRPYAQSSNFASRNHPSGQRWHLSGNPTYQELRAEQSVKCCDDAAESAAVNTSIPARPLEVHSTQQLLKARIRAQRIEPEIAVDPHHQRRALAEAGF